VGNIIRVQASPEKVDGKSLRHIKQRNNPFFSARLESAPVVNMLFRPEEIHGASGIGSVFEPFSKRDARVCDQAFRFGTLHNPVLHFHPNR